MKTLLIHGDDTELMSAWASYLSLDGYAVFTSIDALEAAEIVTMLKLNSVIISSNTPASYLILGKALMAKKSRANIVAITRIRRTVLEILLETEEFTMLEPPVTFSALKGMATTSHQKTEEIQDVLV